MNFADSGDGRQGPKTALIDLAARMVEAELVNTSKSTTSLEATLDISSCRQADNLALARLGEIVG